MNICIFNGDMSRGGGTERITQILANGLSEQAQYIIYVLNLNNESGKCFYPLNENVHFVVLNSVGIKNKIIELRHFLKKENIDILINVDVMLGIYSLPATFLQSKTKIISWEMFNIRNDIGSKHTDMIRKICLRRSAYYINQTKGDMEAFLKEMPVKCPITYIYNPCEIDNTYTDYDVKSKTIVTAGHFFYTKGYDLAVEVAKKVFERHPDWCWKFYGDGKELENIKKMVQENDLENNGIFFGRTSQILKKNKKSPLYFMTSRTEGFGLVLDVITYKAAFYVMTSRTEGFGLVLTEAKSCNLPTLAYDIDFGPREIIDNGVSGYLVEAYDSDVMAEKICELIEDEEKRALFAKRAKENCGKFTKETFISKWTGIFDKIEGK